MVLQRDSQTGQVVSLGVDHNNNPLFADAELGESRRAYMKLVEDENKLERLIELIDRANNPVRNLETSRDAPLLYQEHDPIDDDILGCPNAEDRPGMWVQVQTFGVKAVDPDAPFLNRLAHFCREAGIRQFGNSRCLRNKEMIEDVMPSCEWPQFREWAVTLSSCHASFAPEEKVTRAYFHLFAAIDACQSLLFEYHQEAKQLTGELIGKEQQTWNIDIFGVGEVIYWMLTTLDTKINPSLEGRWAPDFLPMHITAPAVARAIAMSKEMEICPNRFWNLAGVAERKQVDLPGLMETAVRHSQLRHAQHNNCTPGFCTFTTLDSTKMQQLHKCNDKECLEQGHLWFNPKLLNESVNSDGRTVWSISEPFRVLQTGSYIAISHVWSDGTGIGLQEVGKVNRCLFEFFAKIISELGHAGIWWDTISIPTDREGRRKAINEMHTNYSNAAATLLHDEYLVNYEWADDGSPCIALALSSWLTRGWTALELIMSDTVFVLFKGKDGQPVVKDLDKDILAKDPGRTTRAHWIASTIIRRLRKKDIDNVSNLMAILKPRNTSWERDRMIIAGLLAGLDDIPSNIQQDQITKQVISRIYRLNPSSVLHGQVTIAETGGWSWCPLSLYHMPVETFGDLSEGGNVLGITPCMVDADGVLLGSWHYRALEMEEIMLGRIVSSSNEMTVVLKTEDALRRWEYCLLLREHNRGGPGQGFLVIPVRRHTEGPTKFIHCRFVGSVRDCSLPRTGEYDARFTYGYFKIGMEGKTEIRGQELCNDDSSKTQVNESFEWLHGKIWIGDSLNGQLLAMHPDSNAEMTKAFALRAEDKQPSPDPQSMFTGKMAFYCSSNVGLSPEPVFVIKYGPNSNSRRILSRLTAEQSWPPETIPAQDRTYYNQNDVSPGPPAFSTELFRLKSEKPPVTFAALDSALLTPDMQTPYKGVWIGCFPVTGYDFVLFHQPSKYQLEVVKLTGGPLGPRGSVAMEQVTL
ncbi:hypothetical protein CNMCM8980_004696 [Aspergillus fumigatiaffinis]|uniref:Heterokaryon incompatibility domain-containing protein n=1 Tax=Aspergillus fumigatiaffinis TaxID=340414 RepID=A0A8H4GQV1_9EURO|nr:hypothetical protein CNMCM6805_004531 [Aspergillus fumigatiaffinis]KAF4232800.1 hypothetical protein CNMCM8980_004696 [Aspergillus fumigatiaffinis]